MSVAKLGSCGHCPYALPTGSEPGWRENVQTALRDTGKRFGTTLPIGNSNGDICPAAADHVFMLRGLGRLFAADWKTSVARAKAGSFQAVSVLVICLLPGIALKRITP